MIKDASELKRENIIDLTGPDGNAHVLLGQAQRLSKQLGFDELEITKEMTSGDYDNLVEVFDKHFGDFVTLYR